MAAPKKAAPKKAVKKKTTTTKDLYTTLKTLVKEGIDDGYSVNEIKEQMLKSGCEFSKINSLYTQIKIDLGLVLPPKDAERLISEAFLKEMGTTPNSDEFKEELDMTFDELETIIKNIDGSIEGVTTRKIKSVIKNIYDYYRMPLPLKTPKEGRDVMGPIPRAVVNVFAKNKKATLKELIDAIRPVMKNPDKAESKAKSLYKMAILLANGLRSDDPDAFEKLSKESYEEVPEPEQVFEETDTLEDIANMEVDDEEFEEEEPEIDFFDEK